MTRTAISQQQRPQHRGADQHHLRKMAFHSLPYLAAGIVPALLALAFAA